MMNSNKVKNRLKEVSSNKGVSNHLIALKCNVHYTTVSQWFSNRQQPNIENTIKLLKLLEVDFSDIIVYESQILDTGLGKVLDQKYNELIKIFPLKVSSPTLENGILKQVYNPLIIKELENLERLHKGKKE